MKHVLLNPYAGSQQAGQRWRRIENHFTDHQITMIEDQETLITSLAQDDQVICAGGDGTAHHFVNEFIKLRGLGQIQNIRVGYLGIGSNNSFIQPENQSTRIGPFYARHGADTTLRDLVAVTIQNEESIQTRYMLSNGSFGLLAAANEKYNRDPFIQRLKKKHLKLAEMYTFLKTVTSFESIKLNLESDIFQFEGTISNLNIMKSAFYTKDLYYPKNIPPDSGQFKILLLEQNGPWSLLCRFLKAFLFGQMSSAFNREWQANSLRVNSPNTIPLEIDGEIYWGQKFDFQCQSKKMRVCL